LAGDGPKGRGSKTVWIVARPGRKRQPASAASERGLAGRHRDALAGEVSRRLGTMNT